MLTRASLRFYAATNVMVVVGVAVAVAVLAGALLVGSSVRDSLREIALGRLGATDVVISSPILLPRGAGRRSGPRPRAVGCAPHGLQRRGRARRVATDRGPRDGLRHRRAVRPVPRCRRRSLSLAARRWSVRRWRENSARGRATASRCEWPSRRMFRCRRCRAGARTPANGSASRCRACSTSRRSPSSRSTPSQGPVLAIYVPMERLQRDLELGRTRQHDPGRVRRRGRQLIKRRSCDDLIAPAATTGRRGAARPADAGRRRPSSRAAADSFRWRWSMRSEPKRRASSAPSCRCSPTWRTRFASAIDRCRTRR